MAAMDPRAELEMLRKRKRLAELEAKAGGTPQQAPQAPSAQEQPTSFRASRTGRWLQGMADPVIGTAQVLAHQQRPEHPINEFIPNIGGLKAGVGTPQEVDARIQENEQTYQQARQQAGQTGFDWMRLGGNVMSPANYIPGKAALTAQGASLPVRMGVGSVAGATSSAMQPVTQGDYATEKGNQTLIGAGVGGAVPAIGAGVSRMLNPTVSKNAQTLLDEGIPLTTGRRFGKVGSAIEDKLRSMPVMGDAIGSAQRRTIEGFNRSAVNRALKPLGQTLPDNIPTGSAAVEHAGEVIGKAYDDVLSRMTAAPDRNFINAIDSIGRTVAAELPEAQAKQFQGILRGEIGKFMGPNGGVQQLAGDQLKGIARQLREKAAGLSRSQEFNNQELGRQLGEVQKAFERLLVRTNPQHAGTLKQVDRAFAAFARVRDAASSTSSVDGIFSPTTFQQAVRRMDRSAGKGDFAKGRALLQDLSNAAKDVIPSQVPNSGTIDRAALNLGVLGGGFALHPGIPAGLVAGGAAYTQPGQAAINALLFSRPELLRRLAPGVSRHAPLLSGPASALATQNYGGP